LDSFRMYISLFTYLFIWQIQPMSDHHNRLMAMREQMQIRATLQGPEIYGYILPSTDEHLNTEVAVRDQRLRYLSGFTGVRAFAAVANKGAAMWVEDRYAQQADGELECDWEIYLISGNVTVADWLGSHIGFDKRVGADPHLVPHSLWIEWERQLDGKLLKLVKINTNLVDHIWGSERPETPKNQVIKVHEKRYAGEKWQDKVKELRKRLAHLGCDAMVVTSLTEVAYLLNIRGTDIPYTPVVKVGLLFLILVFKK